MFAAKTSLHWPRPLRHCPFDTLALAPAVLGAAIVGPDCAAKRPARRRRGRASQYSLDLLRRPRLPGDQPYQQVLAYRLNLNQTPNIGRLANAGMRFDNCFVTNSICGPCRAVIQTGKYSHKNGFYTSGNKFDGAGPSRPSPSCSEGRIPDGRRRQVAPRRAHAAPGLRLLRVSRRPWRPPPLRHGGRPDEADPLLRGEVDQWEMYDVANDPEGAEQRLRAAGVLGLDQARLAEELPGFGGSSRCPRRTRAQSRAGAAERKRPAAGQSRSAGLGRPAAGWLAEVAWTPAPRGNRHVAVVAEQRPRRRRTGHTVVMADLGHPPSTSRQRARTLLSSSPRRFLRRLRLVGAIRGYCSDVGLPGRLLGGVVGLAPLTPPLVAQSVVNAT